MKSVCSWFVMPVAFDATTNPVEIVFNALTHVSIEVPVNFMDEKSVSVIATESVAVGVPGNLNLWIEVSPYPSTTATAYWTRLGSVVTIAGTGVNLTVHPLVLPWTTYSAYMRLVVQTPVPALAAGWLVQAMYGGTFS